VLASEEPAGPAEARLNLVHDENDSVLRRNASQLVQKDGGCRQETAFAEDRFDDHRRHTIGGDDAVKDLGEGSQCILGRYAVAKAWKRRVVDLAAKRPEVLLVRRVLAGHRQR
jgi:hypothetical protein